MLKRQRFVITEQGRVDIGLTCERFDMERPRRNPDLPGMSTCFAIYFSDPPRRQSSSSMDSA